MIHYLTQIILDTSVSALFYQAHKLNDLLTDGVHAENSKTYVYIISVEGQRTTYMQSLVWSH